MSDAKVNGMKMFETRVVWKEPFRVVGEMIRFDPTACELASENEIGKLWPRFNDRVPSISRVIGGAYGISLFDNCEGVGKPFDYLASVGVSEFEDVPPGLTSRTIPGGAYCIITRKGTINEIGEAYRFYHESWLPESGYEWAGGLEMEFYDERYRGNFDPESVMELWFPVKPRHVSEDTIDADRFPFIANVEVKRYPGRRIVGVERLVRQAEGEAPLTSIPMAWQEADPIIRELANRVNAQERIGVFTYDPPFGPGQNFRYLAGAEVSMDAPRTLPSGTVERTLPESIVAVIAYEGPFAEIGQAWEFFHGHWLKQSAYKTIDDWEYELLADGIPGSVAEVVRMELHVPIRLKVEPQMPLTTARSYDSKLGAELQDLRYARIHMANFKGAELRGIDMRGVTLEHVNFVNSSWKHIYFSNVSVDSIQWGGTVFENVRRPNPAVSSFDEEAGTDGWVNAEPVVFRNSDMSESVFENCDLSHARLDGCRLSGMTINGIPVEQLLKAYQSVQERE